MNDPLGMFVPLVSEEFYILGYNAVQAVGSPSMFRRNMSLSSGSKNKPSKKPA
jgi:hypothetical protein